MTSIYVFVGPTLSSADIKQQLPEAICLPPARAGDIFQLMRLKPQCILLIDGYFESCPSVWHKELLYALSEGVQIIGASSMGAMRAAELAPQGMIGIGKAFNYFYQETISDDDEVALLHLGPEKGYQALSNAMIDIRETLKKAVNEKIISSVEASQLIDTAKNIHFRERRLEHIIKQHLSDQPTVKTLLDWLTLNTVNQKRLDALEAINFIKTQPPLTDKKTSYISTSYSRLLQAQKNITPFKPYDWLSGGEKLLSQSDPRTKQLSARKRLARALAICYNIASSRQLTPSKHFTWLETQSHSNQIRLVEQLLQSELTKNCMALDSAKRFVQLSQRNDTLTPLDNNFIKCWACISKIATKALLVPSKKTLGKQRTAFIQRQKITDFNLWLAHNRLTDKDFDTYLTHNLQFNALIKNYQTDRIGGFKKQQDYHWLLETLSIKPT